jgi:hypothetical protein
MPVALMGFALQSVVPLVQPRIVSDAVALLAFSSSGGLTLKSVGCRTKKELRRSEVSIREPVQAFPTFRALLRTRSCHQAAGVYAAAKRVALLSFSPPGCSPSLE